MNWINIFKVMACRLFSAKPITWTNAALSIRPSGTNFSEIVIKIQKFLFTKLHLKISSAKWRPFCPGGDDLNRNAGDCLSSQKACIWITCILVGMILGYNMVGVAVVMVISIMHEKSCIDSHNARKFEKSSKIQSFTHLAITMMKLWKCHSHEFLTLS